MSGAGRKCYDEKVMDKVDINCCYSTGTNCWCSDHNQRVLQNKQRIHDNVGSSRCACLLWDDLRSAGGGGNCSCDNFFTYKQIQRDSYLRQENEKWFDVESVFSNALNTINLMPPLIETMEINGIEPKEAIKQIQRYQVNANICLDQILTSLDSADYRKVRTLSNSMERAREKFCQVMQNRAEIYEKLFRVNEKEIAERILEVEKQEQKSLPIRVRMRCQEAVARAHGLNFDELKIELEQLNEAIAKMHADIFRPLLQLKQRTFELIRTELSQKADRILNFGGDTHADT